MSPPNDPVYWGVTMFPGADFQASAFHLVDFTEERGKALIDFTKARDNDYFEKAFEMKADGEISVLAIGEYSDGNRYFVDYGWIEDARTGDVVWEMTKRNTEHAGGGEKNRMFDGPVQLEAGTYVAYYITDDSHSYRDWNTSRPYLAKSYGLSIFPGQDFQDDKFELIRDVSDLRDASTLAKITRVRDHERRRDRFTLDEETEVRIQALGEGQGRRMYDYGWIIDDETGRTVWEMTWRKTDHAGGADKNRECDDIITLDAGTYEVYFETDGSHSFGDWNASPPRHPKDWGIMVMKAN
jgi:hypothetical protein